MLKTVRNGVTRHAVARNQKIPIGVTEFLTGKREKDAPDEKRFQCFVIASGELPTVLPPVVLSPRVQAARLATRRALFRREEYWGSVRKKGGNEKRSDSLFFLSHING